VGPLGPLTLGPVGLGPLRRLLGPLASSCAPAPPGTDVKGLNQVAACCAKEAVSVALSLQVTVAGAQRLALIAAE